jgi:hypothetical protein
MSDDILRWKDGTPPMVAYIHGRKEPVTGQSEMRQIGDYMQSEASRLREYVVELMEQGVDVPYEVRGSVHGLNSAIKNWTVLRAKEARS